MINEAGILNLLQKVISKTLEDRVPNYTPLLTLLKRNKGVVMQNSDFYITETTEGFSGIGQYAVGSTLEGGDTQDVQFKASAKNLFATVKVDDRTLQILKHTPAGAIADFTSSKIAQMEKGISNEFNRTFFGDGTGKVARADGAGTTTATLVVQGLDVDGSDLSGARYIQVGDYIKVGSSASVKVTAKAGLTLTLAATRSWSDNDTIIKTSADGGATSEMAGLGNLVAATGTVQNVDLSQSRSIQAVVDSATYSWATHGDAALNTAWIQTLEYREGRETAIFMNRTNFAGYGKTLTALKKTANTSEKVFGGVKYEDINKFVSLEFQGSTVFYDPDCPTKVVFMIEPQAFTIGDMGGGVKFATAQDTTVWNRISGTTPTYEAVMRFYGNLICKNFAANAKLTGYGA